MRVRCPNPAQICIFVVLLIVFGWLLSKTIVPRVRMDPTLVRWAHAVNSAQELQVALTDASISMLEADVVLGTLSGEASNSKVAVMAHPPRNTSDIALEDFLRTVREAVSSHRATKGVKLDLKSTQVVEAALKIVADQQPALYPIWLNADILRGPGAEDEDAVVDADVFLSSARSLVPESVLSLGWTTRQSGGAYSMAHVQRMLEILQKYGVKGSQVTFPVRASLASASIDSLAYLLRMAGEGSTLTLWTAQSDLLRSEDVAGLITKIGASRTYVDLPPDLERQVRSRLSSS